MTTSSNSSLLRDEPEAIENRSAAELTTANEIDMILSALPTRRGLTASMKQYRGYWFDEYIVPGILSVQEKFRGKSDQIVLASFPKSGTTWLKALLFCITNRSSYDFTASGGVELVNGDNNNNPLLSCNPHACVPFLEVYATTHLDDPNPDLTLLNTHLPYSLLPNSMIDCGSKIVYVMREPKDVVVSLLHYVAKILKDVATVTLDDTCEMFCDGLMSVGPYWDHVVEYLKASLKSPDMVLVITYEDLMKRPVQNVKRLADFIGQSFTIAEEDRGVVEGIISFCSFDKLSNLEVNKAKTSSIEGIPFEISNDAFFRKAKVGDWRNHLNDEQRKRIDNITHRKFKDIGGCLSDYLDST